MMTQNHDGTLSVKATPDWLYQKRIEGVRGEVASHKDETGTKIKSLVIKNNRYQVINGKFTDVQSFGNEDAICEFYNLEL